MAWEQLLDIIHDDDRGPDSNACPRCGGVLSSRPDGGLFCTFDGYGHD
jgi:hypothetical protein